MNLEKIYDKHYKKTLILPTVLLAFAIIYLIIFYAQTGSIINRDITLTGGTSYTIQTDFPKAELENRLSNSFQDFSIKSVSDGTGKQIQIIVTVTESESEQMKSELENILGFKLTSMNSSEEYISSSLSGEFYSQLIIAIILAFFLMALVVFVIFGEGGKLKAGLIISNLIFAIFLGTFFTSINTILAIIIFLTFAISFIYIYIKKSVPAFAVILSAFADIIMTLAIVNILNFKVSTAGIVAFLMLIGYSVDTDIMLTTRLLKQKEKTNKTIQGAFKTGTTMTLTSIIAVATALFVVYSFSSVLNEIFTILLIGLSFDLLNTWITNASILKWYVEKNEKQGGKK